MGKNVKKSSFISHGGLSEDESSTGKTRLKAGDISWVPLCKADNFRNWKLHFEIGASTYLSKRVFDNVDERNGVYSMAILKAAEGNDVMLSILRKFIQRGFRGEQLLDKLSMFFDK